MDNLTVKDAGVKWGVTGHMVTHYCVAGRIKGATKKRNLGLSPVNVEKPVAGRRKKNPKRGVV